MSKRGLAVAVVVGLLLWWLLRPKSAAAATGAGTPYPPGTPPVDVEIGPITVIGYDD